MKTVYIFGDSFSDPDHDYAVAGNYKWAEELSKKYNIKNLSKKGTGPEYQIKNLINLIRKTPPEELAQSKLIFFVSDPMRKYWKFLKPKHQYLIPYIIHPSHRQNNFDLFCQTKDYLKYNIFLRNYDGYKGIQPNEELIIFYNSLYSFAHRFSNTLVWPCFHCIPETFLINNTHNFNTINTSLIDISSAENVDDKQKNMHLHFLNHQIMLEQLSNWIDKNTHIDVKKFRSNIE